MTVPGQFGSSSTQSFESVPATGPHAGGGQRRRRKRRSWTLHEDRLVRQHATAQGLHLSSTVEESRLVWQLLAQQLPGRQPAEIRNRWEASLNPSRVKGAWDDLEDERLRTAVATHGPHDWNVIASEVDGRSAKQCRERWCHNLAPDVAHGTWTQQEHRVLIAAHAELGNAWAEIARRLPGRTSSSVKNAWNALQRRHHLGPAAAPAQAVLPAPTRSCVVDLAPQFFTGNLSDMLMWRAPVTIHPWPLVNLAQVPTPAAPQPGAFQAPASAAHASSSTSLEHPHELAQLLLQLDQASLIIN